MIIYHGLQGNAQHLQTVVMLMVRNIVDFLILQQHEGTCIEQHEMESDEYLDYIIVMCDMKNFVYCLSQLLHTKFITIWQLSRYITLNDNGATKN